MSDYIISTDACGDMPDGFAEKYGIPIVPMPYSLKMPKGAKKTSFFGKANGEFDLVECRTDTTGFLGNMKGFFDTLRNGAIPHTSQANAEDTRAVLEPYVKEGHDVLHITFSSGMSGTFNSARLAADELMQEYPGRKILVVDSLGGVGGEGLCVMDAIKFRDEDKLSIEDNQKKLVSMAKGYHHYFTLGDIGFIARSGRISTFEYMFASLLNITVIIGLDGEGKCYPAAKVRGMKNVYKKFIELYETEKGDADNSEIILSHGDNLDGIKVLGAQMTEKFPEIKKIDYTFVNQMVGCNSGPESLALFFHGKDRKVYTK